MDVMKKVVFLFLLPALSHAAPILTPNDVFSKINSIGVHGTVLAIWKDESQHHAFLAGVASGQADWLLAAKAIEPATDAGSAEELADALALALVNNPYGALPWLREYWWKNKAPACIFAYDSELPGGVADYVARLEAALAKPAPRRLRSLRDECLEGLRRTKHDVAPR